MVVVEARRAATCVCNLLECVSFVSYLAAVHNVRLHSEGCATSCTCVLQAALPSPTVFRACIHTTDESRFRLSITVSKFLSDCFSFLLTLCEIL